MMRFDVLFGPYTCGGEVVNGGRCTSLLHPVIELRDNNEVLDIEKQLKSLEKNIP